MQDIALLLEELRIRDTRTASIDPHHHPRYSPKERRAILELRAAQGWSMQKTADRFFVSQATIASWMKRLDEQGPDALLQLREPVNKFSDFVRCTVQRLKTCRTRSGRFRASFVSTSIGSTNIVRT